MADQETGPELAPVRDIKSDPDAEALAALIETRRKELDITNRGPLRPVFKLPEIRELTPEQEAYVQRRLAMEEKARIARQKNETMAALVGAAGARYAECRLVTFSVSNPKQQAVVEALNEYLSDLKERIAKREGVVLFGPVGTGKDHLAFAVARHAAVSGFRVSWVNGQDWFGDVRDAMDSPQTTERQQIGRLNYPEVLVLSDPLPPVGNLSPHMATMLYRLVSDRYEAGRITIVTVNVKDDAEADERLGVPTWDRLCDGAWKLRCNWPSHRKPARIIGA